MYNSSTCPIDWLVSAVQTNGGEGNATGIDGCPDGYGELICIGKQLNDHTVTSVILALALMFISIFILLLGNVLLRPTLFLTSFLCAGSVALAAMPSIVSNFVMEDNATFRIGGGLRVVGGIVVGLTGFCFVGVCLGLFCAVSGPGSGYIFWLLVSLFVPIGPWNVEVGPTTLMHIVCMLIGALLGAFLSMYCYQKSVLIVATSALGAFGVVAASAFLLAHADTRFLGIVRLSDQISPDAYIFIWPQAVFMFVLFLSGVYFQCKRARPRKRTDDQTTGLALARVRLIETSQTASQEVS
jgi:hypothetical protein